MYKVGILGCANIARRSVIPAIHNSIDFEVYAIGSRTLEKAQALSLEYNCKAYQSYEEVINDSLIDVVYIPLPTGMHYEWIKKALLAGKHVISEKSLANNLKEVEELTSIAKSKKLLLFENFQFRFHNQHKWVVDFISSGNIGEVRCFRSYFGFPPFSDKQNIRYSVELGGGALLDAAAYTFKSLQVILPQFHFDLKAANIFRPKEFDVDIWGGAYLSSSNGIIAELSWGFDNFYQCNYELWGSLGKLSVTRAFTAPSDLKPLVIFEKQGYSQEIRLPEDDHFANMLTYVSSLLRSSDFEQEYKQNIKQSAYLQQVMLLSK